MRKLTIVLSLALASFFGQAQHSVSGKIVDELGLPIYLATITLESTDTKVHTDYNGDFELKHEKDFHWKIQISAQGYKTESFFILSGGSAGEIILSYNEELLELLMVEQSPPD